MLNIRNPLFLHEIEWKNNGFLFTTPNIKHIYFDEIMCVRMYMSITNYINKVIG